MSGLTEQASLAEYFFEIRGQDALQKILDAAVDADKKSLASEQGRYDTGVDDQISLVQAQTTLAARNLRQSTTTSRAPSMSTPSPCSLASRLRRFPFLL
jgi:outer membrane protein TolC